LVTVSSGVSHATKLLKKILAQIILLSLAFGKHRISNETVFAKYCYHVKEENPFYFQIQRDIILSFVTVSGYKKFEK